MSNKDSKAWSPYFAGALTGLLMVLSIWIAGEYFGASTSFARTAGLIEQTVAPDHANGLAYFTKMFEKEAGIDWQWMFVLGIFLGSLLSSKQDGSFHFTALPDSWKDRFGSSVVLRSAVAFCGGIIALFGARLAGGCPSGHGLSGVSQLAASGYLALIMFFVGGFIVARMLYGRR